MNQLPVPYHELLHTEYRAMGFRPAVVNPGLAHLDFNTPMINAVQRQGVDDPLKIFTHNLLGLDGFQNQRWQQLLEFFTEITCGYAGQGGSVDLNAIASEVLMRYTCDQLTKYPALNNVLSVPAREHYRNLGMQLAQKQESLFGQQHYPVNQHHNQPFIHPHAQGTPMHAGHPPAHTMHPAHARAMAAPKTSMPTQNAVWTNSLTSAATQGPTRRQGRKRVDLIEDHVDNKVTSILDAPKENINILNKHQEVVKPSLVTTVKSTVTSSQSPNDDWYDNAGEVSTITPHEELTPASTTSAIDKDLLNMEIFPQQQEFYEQNVEPLKLPGIIVAAGMYLYTHSVMRKVNKRSRKEAPKLATYIGFYMYDFEEKEFKEVFIKESKLNYDEHELVPQHVTITADEIKPGKEAREEVEILNSYKLYMVDSTVEDQVQAIGVAAAVNTALRKASKVKDSHFLTMVAYAVPESVSLAEGNDKSIVAMRASELIEKFQTTAINSGLSLGVEGVPTLDNVDQVERRLRIQLRDLLDNYLCDSDICTNWDHSIEDLHDIIQLIKQETIGEGLDIDSIIDNICTRATEVYNCEGFKLNEDISVKDTEGNNVKISDIEVVNSFYVDQSMAGYFNGTLADLGIKDETTGKEALQLSRATNAHLFSFVDDMFGTSWAFCDTGPRKATIALSDGNTIVVYAPLENRLPTYRVL